MGHDGGVGKAKCLAVGRTEIELVEDGGAVYAPWMDRSSAAYGRWLPYLRRHPWALSGVRLRPARFQSYLVKTPSLTLLVDAGVGPAAPTGRGGWSHDGVEAYDAADFAGAVSAEEVDVVFVTHSHPLEAGWTFNASGEPAFPEARYVAQRGEWETVPPERAASLGLLYEAGLLDLIDGEEELAEGVTAVPTPGHSPGHQGLLVAFEGEEAFLVGDAFAHPIQIIDPTWSSAQDEDGMQAAWTRMGLLDWLEADRVAVFAGHFPASGYGRTGYGQAGYGKVARGRDGWRYWRPLEAERMVECRCAA